MTDFLRSLFFVTFKRLWAQRGLAFAIELGLIAAVALLMLVPLYADAVNFRVLQTELSVESERQNRPPFVYLYQYVGAWSGDVQWEQAQALDEYLGGDGVRTLGLPSKAVISYFETDLYRLFPTGETNYTETQSLGYFSFATAADIESQIGIVEGALPQPAAPVADSPINVLIYQGMAEELGLQVGDAFTAYNHRDDGATLREIPVRVAGIWLPLNVDAEYWFVEPKFLDDVLLIPRETFVSRLSTAFR
jgi:hypothetical protein